MEKREIERNPKVPALSQKLISLLTELCFRPDDPVKPADLIFVFGSSSSLKTLGIFTKQLLDQNVSTKVFLSGDGSLYKGIGRFLSRPESFYILKEINPKAYPGIEFYTEDKSNNTLENVTEALKILDLPRFKSILYIAKSHASQRCYLTLRKFVPKTELLQTTFDRIYPGTNTKLSRDTWHTFNYGRSRVWGEFLRIKTYGERGDICLSKDTVDIIREIEEGLWMLQKPVDELTFETTPETILSDQYK